MTIRDEKTRLRAAVRAAGKALPDTYYAEAGAAICARLESLAEYRAAHTIFCFASMRREPDTRPLLAHALNAGKRVCVPLCVGAGEMEARRILTLDELAPGAYGILEPPASAPTLRPDEIDLAVIPCLCCDRAGNRLGKGGGYYDRFLSAYRGAAALVCAHRLLANSVPMEQHDRAVPVVLTERGLWRGGLPCGSPDSNA